MKLQLLAWLLCHRFSRSMRVPKAFKVMGEEQRVLTKLGYYEDSPLEDFVPKIVLDRPESDPDLPFFMTCVNSVHSCRRFFLSDDEVLQFYNDKTEKFKHIDHEEETNPQLTGRFKSDFDLKSALNLVQVSFLTIFVL